MPFNILPSVTSSLAPAGASRTRPSLADVVKHHRRTAAPLWSRGAAQIKAAACPLFLFASREFSPRINNSSPLVLGFLLVPVIPVPPTTAFCLCDISFFIFEALSPVTQARPPTTNLVWDQLLLCFHTTGFTAQSFSFCNNKLIIQPHAVKAAVCA